MKPSLPWFLQASSGFKAGCAALFTLPFLAAGCFCLWSLTLRPTLDCQRSRSWTAVDAVIGKAWLEVSSDSDSDSSRVAVEFHYRYHGVRHTGTRHSFVSGSTNVGVGGMERTVRSLSPGKTVTCWVNPDDPREAVIDRSWPAQALIGLFFATPFITVGVAGMGSLALPWLRRRLFAARKAQLLELVVDGHLPGWVLRPFATDADMDGNDVALVIAADDRLPQALGVTMLNLFWNGIVAVFVCVDVISIAAGETGTGLFLSLFLIPFVAIGGGMFWLALKLWRLTRRPGWVAALQPVPDFQGGEVRFCWAWLDARRLLHAPEAEVRIVAQAAQWDEESGSASRFLGRKRRTRLSDPAASRKSELELAAVEIPTLDLGGEIPLHLPSVPSPPVDLMKSKWMPKVSWGCWWQLEVTHRSGEIETADLSKEQKLSLPL